MRPGDGVSVEERQKASEGLEEGPVGEEADALVAVNTPGPVGSEAQAGQAELRALAVGQALLGVRLVELDGCSINLQPRRAAAISTEVFTYNYERKVTGTAMESLDRNAERRQSAAVGENFLSAASLETPS